ncbi:MAG: DNA polymerase Y family protein [Actinomycetota bacterium]|nr:DNA polymerase Y family protein [Actinomycetota bacterium]
MAVRTLVAWCPDWPLVAAALPPTLAVAVVDGGRVLACSEPARAEGVEVGLRRRQAESRCPALVMIDHDPAGDVRAFEPVVAMMASFTPRVEITRAGTCSMATRGPSPYFAGDAVLAARVAEAVDGVLGGTGSCQVGVADGPFAAEQAARLGRGIVAPGASAAFLAPLPMAVLGSVVDDAASLGDLWGRLGIRTLGELAALPPAAVLARFGSDGAIAHRLARGLDERPLSVRTPPPDLTVAAELDPPVESVETAAFVAKSLADRLCARLGELGLAVTCIGIEAETEHGERLSRVWRHRQGMSAAALAQRVRWQLEGWLAGGSGVETEPERLPGRDAGSFETPTAGITLLRLVPDEIGPDLGSQDGFWGGSGAGAERAGRALVRLQGMLGRDAVTIAAVGGARGPAERAHLVSWGDTEPALRSGTEPALRSGTEPAPWPGGLPPPAPAEVHPRPVVSAVVDATGTPVGVTGRGGSTGVPSRLSIAGGPWVDIAAWAGPWPCDERWWDARAHRRRARWQVVTSAGTAHLLALESGHWSVEATYD